MEVLQYFMTNFVQLIPATSKYEEDVEEEVDDVQVEVQGGEHVLLGAERVLVAAPNHQLGVVHDVQAESSDDKIIFKQLLKTFLY